MAAILKFFVQFAPAIYFLLAIGFVVGIRQMGKARHEQREAVYGLENELARRHLSQAVTILALVGLIAVAELVLVVFLAPVLPAMAVMATPTINPLVSPTGTLSPEQQARFQTATPGPASAVQAAGCIPGQIMITSPEPGERIKGQVTLQGTANIPNFGFYKYEFSAVGSDAWTTILAYETPVQDGKLGDWQTSEITPGDYYLRLVVTDNKGNELPACVVPVSIIP